MAITVGISGTRVTNADGGTTGWSVEKIDGTGGTPSAVDETGGVFLQGTGAVSVKVSNQGVRLLYTSGSSYNFNTTHAGRYIALWVNMLAGGLMRTRGFSTSEPGLAICLKDSNGTYAYYAVDGSDTYPGGWVRYVIDPTKEPTYVTAGTVAGWASAIAAGTYTVDVIGMYCNTRPNTAKFDNLVIDCIDIIGSLDITGTTVSSLFEEIPSQDAGNLYGMVTQKAGIYYARGLLKLASTGSASTLADTGKVVVFENPVYLNSSLSEVECLNDAQMGIQCVSGTAACSITFGTKVGSGTSAVGTAGMTFLAEGSNSDPVFDFSPGSGTLTVNLYAGKIEGFGSITHDPDAGEIVGTSITASGELIPTTLRLQGMVFADAAGDALRWVSGIDIGDCRFLNNTRAVHHTAVGSVSYDGLLFSGNTYDVYLSATTGTLTVNPTNGANPSTSLADGSSSVSIVTGQRTVTITGVPTGAEWRLYVEDVTAGIIGSTELDGAETHGGGNITYSYTYSTDTDVVIQVIATGYEEFLRYFTLVDADQTQAVDLKVDLNT